MNEWVFASERPPKEGKNVFVYGTHAVYVGGGVHYEHAIATGKYEDGEWDVYYPIGFRVIAWMDPVLPPKEGEWA